MLLFLSILFYAIVVRALLTRNFTLQGGTYDFHEHPVQFVIVVVFLFAVATGCLVKWVGDVFG